MEYPNRLKELRIIKHESADNLAEQFEISPAYYYHLEKGERRLNEDLLRTISHYYAKSIDYILKNDDFVCFGS